MNIRVKFVFFVFNILLILNYVSSKGCVQLDSFSFDKVASRFKAVLVKFDAAYPYGPKQEEFEKVCETSTNINDLLVVEIAVKDYGGKENEDLAQKFGVKKDNFPYVILIVQGQAKPVVFNQEEGFSSENLKKFIRSKSGVYIGCSGCIEVFDEMAIKFIKAKTTDKKKAVLLETESLWDKAKGNKDKKTGEVYVKIMRKVLEIGDEFLRNENTRVDTLLKMKISKEKKDELQERINILQGFSTPVHDEL